MTEQQPTYQVVGARADFWQRETGRPAYTVERQAMPEHEARDLARYLSCEGYDCGAVDYWPSTGGHMEVRADGALVVAYLDGQEFTPEQWAAREAMTR